MKRTPIKRGNAPLRKTDIGPGRAPLKRSAPLARSLSYKPGPFPAGLARRKGLSATRTPRVRPQDRELALAFRREVCGPQTACIACGRKAYEAHHVLPQQAIKRACRTLDLELGLRLWNADAAVPLCLTCHSRHELAFNRLDRSLVPPGAWRLAGELELRPLLERLYPDRRDSAR